MSLKDLYDSIDLDTIEGFITEQQEEHVSLDFKEVNDSTMDKADRKNFAKALSGFANSSGGIIVWGVQACKQNGDEHDYACDLPGIDDAPLFVQKLNEHEGTMVTPIVEGVESAVIPTGKGPHGFAKTFIPESDLGPHQAKSGITQYFKRSGDSFYKLEHFDIADMFGKRRRPVLSFKYDLQYMNRMIGISFSIENTGRGTAKAPYLAVKFGPGLSRHPYESKGLPPYPGRIAPNWIHYGAEEGKVIHPGIRLHVGECAMREEVIEGGVPEESYIDYKISSEDVALVEGRVIFPQEQLIRLLNPRG